MLIPPDLHYQSSLSEPDPIALPSLEISQYFLGYRPYYILVNSSPLRSGLIKDSASRINILVDPTEESLQHQYVASDTKDRNTHRIPYALIVEILSETVLVAREVMQELVELY